jgi:hypothetical protein
VASAGKNSRERKIGNRKVAPPLNKIRPLEKILLVTLSDFDKTARHEMCGSDRFRFYCIRFAGIGGITTSFSSESRSAIQQRDDHHRKRFDPASCKANFGYSAEVSILSACKHAGSACVTREVSLLFRRIDIVIEPEGVGVEPALVELELAIRALWQPARQLTMPSKSRKPVRTGA